MVKQGYILTRKQAGDLFFLLSQARLKLTGKYKTLAQKIWEEFEVALGLSEYRKGVKE